MVPIEFEKVLKENGISLEGGRGELLDRYVGMLLEWNERINLISRRDTERIWDGHILHSLSPMFMLEFPTEIRMLDLGTGGGLPGIPIAIVQGGIEVTLLDSIAKKVRAVEGMVAGLGVGGVACVAGRAEELGRETQHRGKYDLVIARGVAPLLDLVKWSRPFLRTRGLQPTKLRGGDSEFRFPYLLALKGGDLEGEIRELRVKSGAAPTAMPITVIDIAFRGSSRFAFEGKKLVVVEFR